MNEISGSKDSLGKPLSPEEMAATKGGTGNEQGRDMLIGAVAGGVVGAAVGAAVSAGVATGAGAGVGASAGFFAGAWWRKIAALIFGRKSA
jgi:ABC-type dipeptide/oligopeptide/nickel transport system permease subunit